MPMTSEQVGENARKIFTREYTALFDQMTKDIKKSNKMGEADKLIKEVGEVINGNNAIVVLAVLSVHVISVSNDIKMINAIDELKKKTDVMVL